LSGFVAAVRNIADPELQTQLRKMSQKIAHRGNRGSTTRFSDRCAAVTLFHEQSGFRVDTFCNSKFAIVFDGLLHNKEELRRAVKAERSAGPARIVLSGFDNFGDDWFSRLSGSFALMITDLHTGEVILARDRFAHRPLYFGKSKGCVWVGTEIKAIISAPGFQTTINMANLHSAIGYGVTLGPQTLFTNVYKCVPGFIFRIDASGNYRTHDYFTPTLEQKHNITLADAKDFILHTLTENVGFYLRECPDLGVLLSGGVDSALIAHIAAGITGKSTIAVGFGAKSWARDESGQASEMADRLGLKFARTYVSPQDDLLGSLRNVVSILEEPTRFENALALEMTARDAADKCSALMTGEGADFILGERTHYVARQLSRVLRVPGFLRAFGRILPLEKSSSGHLRALANYLQWHSIRDYMQKKSANCCDLVPGAVSPPANEIPGLLANITSDWPVQAQHTFMILREDAHCWVERMEKISATAGLECFHAFESNEMFQYGLELPDQIRHLNGTYKPAVRSLAADLFDETVAYREKRQLAAPMQLWLNESSQLRTAVLELKNRDSRIRAYLDNAAVDKYLETYEKEGAQNERTAVPVFRMLTFEIWLEMFT
jgi:asparagine synthase (glutamine-hydrolysing)